MKTLSHQYEVTFLPDDTSVTVSEGTTLLQAARTGGVIIEAPCDGRGTCGKCRIKATGTLNAPDEAEEHHLADALTKGVRLACRAKVGGPVQAEVFHSGETFVALAEGRCDQWPIDPPVRKIPFNIDCTCEYNALVGNVEPFFPETLPAMLQELGANYKNGLTPCEAVVKNGKILDWHFHPNEPWYGVAVDIGTTSVVAGLFDLRNGASLGTCSCLNPQIEFGGDVLTRIAFVSQQAERTRLLQEKIVEGINGLISRLLAAQQLHNKNIHEIVIAGNTTMQHLLLGVTPHSLAHAPYRPVFLAQMEVSPAAVGLDMAPRGVVTVLPSASAFVGADIVAGLLAVGLHHYTKTALFIDIGTNGEIVLCKNGSLIGTSSAAGPALEGMNITCGCRAEKGAIESIAITKDGAVSMGIIGDDLPKGLCGSGLIDLVAELVKNGVIEASGRFAKREKLPPALASRLTVINNQQVFMVSEENAVFLSQKDVRQVQLAKGAITAAINLLLQELGIGYANIDEVLVAGAFGFHLKPASLVGIGLLPAVCRDKIRFVGNTSQSGATAVLLNQQASKEIVEIGQQIKIKELSLLPEFQDSFVKCLAFPS